MKASELKREPGELSLQAHSCWWQGRVGRGLEPHLSVQEEHPQHHPKVTNSSLTGSSSLTHSAHGEFVLVPVSEMMMLL